MIIFIFYKVECNKFTFIGCSDCRRGRRSYDWASGQVGFIGFVRINVLVSLDHGHFFRRRRTVFLGGRNIFLGRRRPDFLGVTCYDFLRRRGTSFFGSSDGFLRWRRSGILDRPDSDLLRRSRPRISIWSSVVRFLRRDASFLFDFGLLGLDELDGFVHGVIVFLRLGRRTISNDRLHNQIDSVYYSSTLDMLFVNVTKIIFFTLGVRIMAFVVSFPLLDDSSWRLTIRICALIRLLRS